MWQLSLWIIMFQLSILVKDFIHGHRFSLLWHSWILALASSCVYHSCYLAFTILIGDLCCQDFLLHFFIWYLSPLSLRAGDNVACLWNWIDLWHLYVLLIRLFLCLILLNQLIYLRVSLQTLQWCRISHIRLDVPLRWLVFIRFLAWHAYRVRIQICIFHSGHRRLMRRTLCIITHHQTFLVRLEDFLRCYWVQCDMWSDPPAKPKLGLLKLEHDVIILGSTLALLDVLVVLLRGPRNHTTHKRLAFLMHRSICRL